MATDKEKKNWGQVARQGYDQYANETTAAGEQAANDLSAAGQQQVTDISAANQAYYDSLNEAQRQYRQRMDEGFTQFSDIINAENQRIADERARAEAENKATLQAARWTGATELAASVANLIGVGQFGASNQQYKSYSQDWMKKADQDLKYNRARLDNMRDRQRALQQHMIQLRMNDAGHAASMATQAAGAKHQGDVSLAGARYNAAAAPVNIRFQTAEKAAEAKAKGAATEATMGQQKDAQDAQIGLGYARLNQAEQQHKDNMLTYGYEPDGKGGWSYNPDANARIRSGRSTTSSSARGGGSGNSGINYGAVIDGKNVTLSMPKETYEQGIKSGTEELKADIADNAAKSLRAVGVDVQGLSWNDLKSLSGEKKIRNKKGELVANPLYGKDGDIIGALDNSGDNKADYEIIERYVKDNKSRVNRFNKHLYGVSNGAVRVYGTVQNDAENTGTGVLQSSANAETKTWEDKYNKK